MALSILLISFSNPFSRYKCTDHVDRLDFFYWLSLLGGNSPKPLKVVLNLPSPLLVMVHHRYVEWCFSASLQNSVENTGQLNIMHVIGHHLLPSLNLPNTLPSYVGCQHCNACNEEISWCRYFWYLALVYQQVFLIKWYADNNVEGRSSRCKFLAVVLVIMKINNSDLMN